jgi:DNA polymerase III delta prime subunit
MSDQILWTEKYRPHKIADCVLPKSLKDTFQSIVDNFEMTNLLLVGPAGVGKTTVAKALCDELDVEYLFINASLEGNIDTLRTKIHRFASSVSLMSDKRKYIILDEADYLNRQSTQPALRAFMEEFASNCGFIMTCNFQNRLIEPLWSRASVIEFRFQKADKKQLLMEFYKRCLYILDSESITYDQKSIAQVISKYYPDFRRSINELQRFSAVGNIDSSILVSDFTDFDLLSDYIRDKDFTAARQWAADNSDVDSSFVFRKIFVSLLERVENHSIPQIVLILNDAQKADAIVADKELNMIATLTELMSASDFK